MSKMTNAKFRCETCGYETTTEKEMKKHVVIKHIRPNKERRYVVYVLWYIVITTLYTLFSPYPGTWFLGVIVAPIQAFGGLASAQTPPQTYVVDLIIVISFFLCLYGFVKWREIHYSFP